VPSTVAERGEIASYFGEGSDDSAPQLPPVPWHEFLVAPEEIVWAREMHTGERVTLGEGRFGMVSVIMPILPSILMMQAFDYPILYGQAALTLQVYKAMLHGTEPVAVKCMRVTESMESNESSDHSLATLSASAQGDKRNSTSHNVSSTPREQTSSSDATHAGNIPSSSRHSDPYSAEGSTGSPRGIGAEVGAALVRAAKVYRQGGQAETPEYRVLREIALLKGFRSQYIVAFHGACFQAREVMLVTELMPGGDLWSALRAEKINWWNG
jgi:hypothetical protein